MSARNESVDPGRQRLAEEHTARSDSRAEDQAGERIVGIVRTDVDPRGTGQDREDPGVHAPSAVDEEHGDGERRHDRRVVTRERIVGRPATRQQRVHAWQHPAGPLFGEHVLDDQADRGGGAR